MCTFIRQHFKMAANNNITRYKGVEQASGLVTNSRNVCDCNLSVIVTTRECSDSW